jgi:hypothetical protein
MATTIPPATLTITIEEKVTLGGVEYNAKRTKVIADITEVSKRIVNVSTTEQIILAFGTAILPGQFIDGDVRYIRITNKDDTNFVTLVFRSGTAECAHKLDAGHSFVFAGDNSGGIAATHDADSTALTVTLATLDDITADADTAAVDLELYVAGV